jgi:hypothetical protein
MPAPGAFEIAWMGGADQLDDDRAEAFRLVVVSPLKNRRVRRLAVRIAVLAAILIELRLRWQGRPEAALRDDDRNLGDRQSDWQLDCGEAAQTVLIERSPGDESQLWLRWLRIDFTSRLFCGILPIVRSSSPDTRSGEAAGCPSGGFFIAVYLMDSRGPPAARRGHVF